MADTPFSTDSQVRGSSVNEGASMGVARWARGLAARLRMRTARQHRAILFVVPGGSGGFPPVNVELYRDSRAFRDSIDVTGALIEKMQGWRVTAAYRGEATAPTTPAIERRNELVHHGMTRIALIDQWSAAGVTPDGAIGVSLGELIAPYAVGAISREDCARLIAALSQALTDPPSAHRVYLIEMNGDTARRLCRHAPIALHFLGTSNHTLSLVLCRENDSEAARSYLGDMIRHEAPSGWPYHTPAMHFDDEAAHAQLGHGVALQPPLRAIYSPATGELLTGDIMLDAQFLRWSMSGPCFFAEAVSAALADGFDTVVQITGRPMQVFCDVSKQAAAEGRHVQQLHALDANARAKARAMKRRAITPLPQHAEAMPPLEDHWWRDAPAEARDLPTEQACERLLRPLLERKPFDVVAALADPIADAMTSTMADTGAIDRDAFVRLLASSVLILLRDNPVRCRLMSHPELAPALVDASVRAGWTTTPVQPAQRAAISAVLRTLLRLAPDFAAIQPLGTVNLLNGKIPQLVIGR